MKRLLGMCALMIAITLSKLAYAETDHRALADRLLSEVILPGVEDFRQATVVLSASAATCGDGSESDFRDQFHATWDAWMAIQHLGFGPLEQDNRALQIAFWPDGRGRTAKTVARLVKAEDPIVDDPSGFAKISVAGRGLYALERLLYEDKGERLATPYICRYRKAAAEDLERLATEIATEWNGEWVEAVKTAGAPENTIFLAPEEVSQRLLATLNGSLDLTVRLRLGKPLGSLNKPKPRLAEAWRSGRSLRQIDLIVAAARKTFDAAFVPDLTPEEVGQVTAVFATIMTAQRDVAAAGDLQEAVVMDRLKVEILQGAIQRLAEALTGTVGVQLGIAKGFNSADGD